MRLRFGFSRLSCNHHDWRPKPGLKCEWPPYESSSGHVKRSAASIVPLGRDLFMIVEGRKLIGRRLWLYGPSGACVSLDVYLLFKRCPYPPGHRYAARPDWTPDLAE